VTAREIAATAALPPGELAAAMEATARWAEEELAGGTAPKPVAWQMVTAARTWAAIARGNSALEAGPR
jgi:hypothetical protein